MSLLKPFGSLQAEDLFTPFLEGKADVSRGSSLIKSYGHHYSGSLPNNVMPVEVLFGVMSVVSKMYPMAISCLW